LLLLLLPQVGAQTWLSWVQEGLLLDDRTRGLTARLVTYNAELMVFADIQVAFDFQAGGSIQVRPSNKNSLGSCAPVGCSVGVEACLQAEADTLLVVCMQKRLPAR
jgi:hypothetical protein